MKRVYYDLETTSAQAESCRIVEFCFADEWGKVLLHEFVNPGCVITAGATEVHGISATDVMGCARFDVYAPQIQELIEDAEILVGFNNISFDSIILDRELMAADQPGLKKDEFGLIIQPEIDLFAVWKNKERRDLITAVGRFAGINLIDAHSATADTEILPVVLAGMSSAWGPFDFVAASKPEGAIDREGKFALDSNGVPVLNFGKHKGEPVSGNRNYLEWMLSKDFSPEVKAHCRRFLKGR